LGECIDSDCKKILRAMSEEITMVVIAGFRVGLVGLVQLLQERLVKNT